MAEEKKSMASDPKDIEDNKLLGALAYISIICFVPLFLKRDSKFAQFHAKQGLLLFIIELFTFIPFFGWMLFVLAVILAIFGAMNAYQGKFYVLPIIGKYAEKLNI